MTHEENQEMEEFGLGSLITNPGYSIISQKILRCLDHLTFRLGGIHKPCGLVY